MRVDVIEAPELTVAATAQPQPVPTDIDEAGDPLPLARLAGLLGSGTFAFTASLTCFVC